MPLVLNLIYLAILTVCAPVLFYRAWRSGKYREGWSERVLGFSPTAACDIPQTANAAVTAALSLRSCMMFLLFR